MSEKPILLDIQDKIATITLNRPCLLYTSDAADEV